MLFSPFYFIKNVLLWKLQYLQNSFGCLKIIYIITVLFSSIFSNYKYSMHFLYFISVDYDRGTKTINYTMNCKTANTLAITDIFLDALMKKIMQ